MYEEILTYQFIKYFSKETEIIMTPRTEYRLNVVRKRTLLKLWQFPFRIVSNPTQIQAIW